MCDFPLYTYLKKVLAPVILVLAICFSLSYIISANMPTHNYIFILSIVLILILCLSTIILIGFNKDERRLLVGIIKGQ